MEMDHLYMLVETASPALLFHRGLWCSPFETREHLSWSSPNIYTIPFTRPWIHFSENKT